MVVVQKVVKVNFILNLIDPSIKEVILFILMVVVSTKVVIDDTDHVEDLSDNSAFDGDRHNRYPKVRVV